MIIVDSNIFIFGEVANTPENRLAIARLEESLMRDEIGINAIIASEVFHKLQLFFGRVEAEGRVARIVSHPKARFNAFGPETVLRAMKLSRDFQLRINDALIAQQAIELDAPILTDNVRDFRKIKSIRVIPLRSR